MGVTSQSRSSHHNTMKVLFALAGLVAASAAYPMFLLEEAPAYEPVYRVARQAPQMADDFVAPSRFAQAARRRIQEEEDLMTLLHGATTTPSLLTLPSIINTIILIIIIINH